MGMDVYIKKYFWVVGIVVVMLCSALAATAVGHVIAATALSDSDKPVRRQAMRPAAATPNTPTGPSKNGDPLAARHMFCSECVPVEPETTEDGPVVDSDAPPMTGLPLKLVATNVSTNEKSSFATVLNTQNNVQGAYWVGNEIPSAGPVVRISGRYVDFENKGQRRVERMSLLAQAPSAPKAEPKTVATRKPSRASNKNDLMAAVDEGVKKVGDNDYEIDRALVDKVLANPTAVARGARIVPSVKNGQPNGFKLYAIRPSSVYAKIGLMNGDTLHAVNGFELNSMDKALEVYTKVRESSNLSVEVTRRGKPMTLSYSIK